MHPSFALTPVAFMAAAPGGAGVQETVLKNGMKVLLVEDHAAPVATFSVFYRVGSRQEGLGNTGSAHLLEHMMFKGTESRPKGAIMALLDRIGAQWNATTYYDYTNYYETVPVEKLETVISLEADRMVRSLILDEERDLERIVVRNELERGENSPTRALINDLWAEAYKAHPYHHPVIGWRSDVEGVPTEKLRDFYRLYYQPDNAIAVAIGDFKADDALAMIEKHFGGLTGSRPLPVLYTAEPPQRGERRFVLNQAGDLKVVGMAWKAPAASDPDMVPLKLIQLILSGELDLGPFGDSLDPGISNRLYQGLVEKELVTYAGIYYAPLKDPGIFSILALPRPEMGHDKVEKAIRVQIERLKTEKVSTEELERAKARAAAAYGMMQDGTSGRAMLLGYFAVVADWRLAQEFSAKVQAVTADDLLRAAKKYFVEDQLTTGWFVPLSAPKRAAVESGEIARSGVESIHGFDGQSPHGADGQSPGVSTPGASEPLAPATAAAAVQRTVLANGLTVLIRENHSSPTFSIAGSVKAGGAFDPLGKPNTALLTAECLTRGTIKSNKLQIAKRLEEVGASLNYFPGSEEVSLQARGLSRDFDRVLELLAETLSEPSFPSAEVQKLKRETIAQLQQREDSPATRARRAFQEGLYPKGHPYYVYPLEETIESIRSLSPGALQAFHKAHYGGNTTVIAVVGDVDGKAVLEAIEKRLGKLPKVQAKLSIPKVPVRTQPGRETVYVPDKPNVEVLFGQQGEITRADPDYYPAMLGNFIFGGAASSRLFQHVRDRLGLTYGIYSSLSASHGAGPWSVSLTLNPENVDKALPIVANMSEELVRDGVTDQELASAKETLVGKYKVGLATNSGMAGVLAIFESYGFPPDFVEQHPRKIEAVTREQVGEVLKRTLRPKDALVVIAGSYPPAKAAPAP
jgi:zinc protease